VKAVARTPPRRSRRSPRQLRLRPPNRLARGPRQRTRHEPRPRFPRCPTSPRSFQQARALRKASRALTCARRGARRCSGGCVRRDRDASETTIPRRGSARSEAGVAPAGRFSLPAAARVLLADEGQFNRASRKRAAGKSTDRAKRIGACQSGAGCKQPSATGNGPSRDADRLR
jgi:hypothetical protein